jgi:putative ABC transport system ATP-binding protein
MQHAATYGTRILMLDQGEIILDITHEEGQHLSVQGLINKFSEVRQGALMDDELLLSGD